MECCLPRFEDCAALTGYLKGQSHWDISSQDLKNGLVLLSSNLWLEKEPETKLKQKPMKKASRASHNL